MDESLALRAKEILYSNHYMCLATTGKYPWAAPLFFAFDSNYRLYFKSALDSLHVQHVLTQPRVAVAIYSSVSPLGQGEGLQIEGIAEIVPPSTLPRAIAVYYQRRFPNEAERACHNLSLDRFSGDANVRLVMVTPLHVYALDPEQTEIDRRREVLLR